MAIVRVEALTLMYLCVEVSKAAYMLMLYVQLRKFVLFRLNDA